MVVNKIVREGEGKLSQEIGLSRDVTLFSSPPLLKCKSPDAMKNNDLKELNIMTM